MKHCQFYPMVLNTNLLLKKILNETSLLKMPTDNDIDLY